MKIFKNTETKKTLLISLAATLAVAAFAYWVQPVCAVFVIITGVITACIYAVSTELRYRRLEKMSIAIDKILHGSDETVISEFREGELAILKNEISKMTKRLRESADALGRDKVFLTDSIADISHQLRTPLTSVNLLISSLSDKELDYEKRLRVMYELKHLVSRIEWLIDTLLKLSKIDAGTAVFEKKETDVKELVMQSAQPLMAAMDVRGQSFDFDLEPITFDCDRAWSAEALSNILKNCMEHNPDGGRISVRARKTNIFTEISVKDEGGGFAKEDLPHIFERFYKGKSDSSEGFGIGLALARVIITSQGGTIKAENAKEGGARFVVRFYYGIR
ncbi:MAG: HAMP domain-containing histidine kinase [Clostridia bacterium]|nr:HAMP domain-containing histidine kinase [Clostridia bacterium]